MGIRYFFVGIPFFFLDWWLLGRAALDPNERQWQICWPFSVAFFCADSTLLVLLLFLLMSSLLIILVSKMVDVMWITVVYFCYAVTVESLVLDLLILLSSV